MSVLAVTSSYYPVNFRMRVYYSRSHSPKRTITQYKYLPTYISTQNSLSVTLRICALCAHLYLPIITVRAPCAHHTNINMEPYTCTCCCLKYHAIIIDFTPLYQYLTLLYCQWYNSPYMSHNISLELVDIVKYFCKII